LIVRKFEKHVVNCFEIFALSNRKFAFFGIFSTKSSKASQQPGPGQSLRQKKSTLLLLKTTLKTSPKRTPKWFVINAVVEGTSDFDRCKGLCFFVSECSFDSLCYTLKVLEFFVPTRMSTRLHRGFKCSAAEGFESNSIPVENARKKERDIVNGSEKCG
jgi:hypothetical protein